MSSFWAYRLGCSASSDRCTGSSRSSPPRPVRSSPLATAPSPSLVASSPPPAPVASPASDPQVLLRSNGIDETLMRKSSIDSSVSALRFEGTRAWWNSLRGVPPASGVREVRGLFGRSPTCPLSLAVPPAPLARRGVFGESPTWPPLAAVSLTPLLPLPPPSVPPQASAGLGCCAAPLLPLLSSLSALATSVSSAATFLTAVAAASGSASLCLLLLTLASCALHTAMTLRRAESRRALPPGGEKCSA
mmetsp:Transcript_7681/g.31199  ORF Transcript_7681/g.31199 Transcript_7681/m.31199 type:complete len:247 (-) Transcript_7681:274-1014(-)